MQKHQKTIDAYIQAFPPTARGILRRMRTTIRKAAPRATETIRYGIPTFQLHGNLVHFGGFAKHVSFFPAPSAIRAFAKELKPYVTSKGTVQFPLGKKVPYALVARMVAFRVKENLAAAKSK